jgi:hypothetical protein
MKDKRHVLVTIVQINTCLIEETTCCTSYQMIARLLNLLFHIVKQVMKVYTKGSRWHSTLGITRFLDSVHDVVFC